MNAGARFINVGRGQAVVERDLADALKNNDIAGAMLDVFQAEPLGQTQAMWDVPNLFVSPHISGDFHEFEQDIVQQFISNLDIYFSNERFPDIIDKDLGFVPSSTDSH